MELVSNNNIIYFYGINDINYCFSNFYPSRFTDEKNIYNCSEQFFMKKKQELFDPNNSYLSNCILNESDPAKIKKFGRSVHNYDETIWNEKRYDCMCEGLYYKFSQNLDLKKILLDTGNSILVEASPYDRIWGIGISVEDAKKGKKWNGQNLLGNALMKVRKVIIDEYSLVEK